MPPPHQATPSPPHSLLPPPSPPRMLAPRLLLLALALLALRPAAAQHPIVSLTAGDLAELTLPDLSRQRSSAAGAAAAGCAARPRAFFGVTVFFGRSFCAAYRTPTQAAQAVLTQMATVAGALAPTCVTLAVQRIEGYCSVATDPFAGVLATPGNARATLAALRAFWLSRADRAPPPPPGLVVLLAGGGPSAATFQAGACGPLTGLAVVRGPTAPRLLHTTLLALGARYGPDVLARRVATQNTPARTASTEFSAAAVAQVQAFVDGPFGMGCFFERLPFAPCTPACASCFSCSGQCGSGVCTQLSGGIKGVKIDQALNITVAASPSASASASVSPRPSPSKSPRPRPSRSPRPSPSKTPRPSRKPRRSRSPSPSPSQPSSRSGQSRDSRKPRSTRVPVAPSPSRRPRRTEDPIIDDPSATEGPIFGDPLSRSGLQGV